jgi:hypothetical protein
LFFGVEVGLRVLLAFVLKRQRRSPRSHVLLEHGVHPCRLRVSVVKSSS